MEVTVSDLIRMAMASPTSAPSTATGTVTSCPPFSSGVIMGPQHPGAVFATMNPPSLTGTATPVALPEPVAAPGFATPLTDGWLPDGTLTLDGIGAADEASIIDENIKPAKARDRFGNDAVNRFNAHEIGIDIDEFAA